MVQVSYPGVYIQEVPSGVHTITGVATSITAFLGRATTGPINKAVRILSPSDYTREFGDRHPKSDLADSVRLFFANGGTDCYVIRLAKDAVKAQVALHSFNEKVLLAKAEAEGKWGDTVRLEVDYNTSNPHATFNLVVIHEAGGSVVATESFLNLSMAPNSPRFAPDFVTQSSGLITLELAGIGPVGNPAAVINDPDESIVGFSQARRPLGVVADVRSTLDGLINPAAPATPISKFDISVNGSPFETVELRPWPTPVINGASLGDIATHFKNQIDTALAAHSQTVDVHFISDATPGTDVRNLLTIVPTTVGDAQSSVQVRRAASNDIAAALMLGLDQGGIEPTRWSNFRPAPTATLLTLGSTTATVGNTVDTNDLLTQFTTTINNIADLAQMAISSITINGTLVNFNPITIPPGTEKWFKNDPVTGSPHDNNDGVREKFKIIAKAINNDATLPWSAEVWGYHLAVLAKSGSGVSINAQPAADPTTGDADFDGGWIRNTRQYSLGEASTSPFVSDKVAGKDGDPPEATHYIGNEVDQTGIHALDPADLFNLMVIPGDEEVDQSVIDAVLGPASIYCQQRRAFLLIDPPKSWVNNDGRPEVVQDTSLVSSLRALVVKENSAVFYPRLRHSVNGLTRSIGPAGAIAGLMSRTDATRGVWKAPAGLEADIRGIQGLELKLTDRENGVLNKLGVNCLRIFPSGFISWGSRTLRGSDDLASEWKYIPIRRLALFLEEAIFRGTQWVVFEPNDEPLWANIRLNLNAFMMGLFRQGAFQGTTPGKAFYVKCDSETTTQNDRNLGIVNIEVGFAPLKPAEFVVIKIQQIVPDDL